MSNQAKVRITVAIDKLGTETSQARTEYRIDYWTGDKWAEFCSDVMAGKVSERFYQAHIGGKLSSCSRYRLIVTGGDSKDHPCITSVEEYDGLSWREVPWTPFCPFKVGDIIHEIRSVLLWTIWPEAERGNVELSGEQALDPTKPDAVVTAITERGFTYEYDHPAPIGRVEWGEMVTGGECFEGGFDQWRKVGEALDTRI